MERARPACRRSRRRGSVQHALARDAGLDQAARVDADHAGAVDERVEVVGARVAAVRLRALAAARSRRCRDAERSTPRHWRRVLRMRADQDARRRGRSARRSRSGLDPPADEGDLVRGDERRRAEVEDVGRAGVEADLARELRRRSRSDERSNHSSKRCAPVSTTRSAGMPCSSSSSAALDGVPHEDAVGDEAKQPLAGQVVPARHADAGAECRAGARSSGTRPGRRRTRSPGWPARRPAAARATKLVTRRLVGIASSRRASRRCVPSASLASAPGRQPVDAPRSAGLREPGRRAVVETPVQLLGDAAPGAPARRRTAGARSGRGR